MKTYGSWDVRLWFEFDSYFLLLLCLIECSPWVRKEENDILQWLWSIEISVQSVDESIVCSIRGLIYRSHLFLVESILSNSQQCTKVFPCVGSQSSMNHLGQMIVSSALDRKAKESSLSSDIRLCKHVMHIYVVLSEQINSCVYEHKDIISSCDTLSCV